MPRFYKKKPGRPKKYVRKRYTVRRNEKWRISRPLRPRIDSYKRSFSSTIQLRTDTGNIPVGWYVDNGALFTTWTFYLKQLNDITDFTNLYAMYKIKGVRLQMYFSNTQSVISQDSTSGYTPNRQLMVYMTPNREGDAYNNSGDPGSEPLTEDVCLDTQSVKKKLALNGGRPLDIYMSLRQQNVLFNKTDSTAYSTVAPKWLRSDQTEVNHYGLNMRIQRVDDQPLTTGGGIQFCKIIGTLYFQCKQVQ